MRRGAEPVVLAPTMVARARARWAGIVSRAVPPHCWRQTLRQCSSATHGRRSALALVLDDTMAGKLAERDEIVDAVQMAGSALTAVRIMLAQKEAVSLRLSSDCRHHVETTARFEGSVTVTFTLPDGSETELAASASIEQENDRHGQWVLDTVRDAVPALDSPTVMFRCDFRFQKLLRRAFPHAEWVAST